MFQSQPQQKVKPKGCNQSPYIRLGWSAVPTTHKIPVTSRRYGLNHTPLVCGAAGKYKQEDRE